MGGIDELVKGGCRYKGVYVGMRLRISSNNKAVGLTIHYEVKYASTRQFSSLRRIHIEYFNQDRALDIEVAFIPRNQHAANYRSRNRIPGLHADKLLDKGSLEVCLQVQIQVTTHLAQ